MRERPQDIALATFLSVALHAALIVISYLLLQNAKTITDAAAGQPIEASLQVSAADVARANKLLATMKAPVEEKIEEVAPPPEPAQNKPQAMLDKPDTENQDAIDPLAIEKIEEPKPEQEEKREQGQIDLSEEEQRETERKARLRQQFEELKRERERAERLTRMEEERLKQIADRQSPSTETKAPTMPAPPRSGPAGGGGSSDDLLSRYRAAMFQTANANWNRRGAPELVRCKVSFSQIVGGEVTDVRFLDCPFDEEGREFVERALRRTPMPYAGFESVFMRSVTLEFCHPEDACIR
jgi:colicin import membrane protein